MFQQRKLQQQSNAPRKNHTSFGFFAMFTVTGLMLPILVFSQAMQSSSYKIQFDSVNTGGAFASSTNYSLEDTVGEAGTGESTSASYSLKAGFQQMNETFLSITAAGDVTMTPALGGVSGGTSNGSTQSTVTTDSAAGYQLSIVASSSPALVSGANTIADYTPAGANPDFTFSVLSTASEFAFTPEGTDITQEYKDDGASCNTGSSDATDKCWNSLATSNEVIASATAANHPSGTQTTIKFRVEIGSARTQPEGTYTATTTLTAVAL